MSTGLLTRLLSPLTMAGLMTEHDPVSGGDSGPVVIATILMYVCPECDHHHECRDEAVECCATVRETESSGRYQCPVCGGACKDTHVAANCCLWKDLAPDARYRIAMTVEAGAEWIDAIAAEARPS